MSEQPKRKRSKSKRLNVTIREKWNKILKDVEKQEVPVTLLEAISVLLIDGTEVRIDIKELLNDGMTPDEVEQMLNEKLTELDHIIKDVDFYVNIDDVANMVQPITDGFLKDL
jgi:hypothetical protein